MTGWVRARAPVALSAKRPIDGHGILTEEVRNMDGLIGRVFEVRSALQHEATGKTVLDAVDVLVRFERFLLGYDDVSPDGDEGEV